MKEQLAICAAVLLIGAAAARAQPIYAGPAPYGPPAVLPPYEVVSIVRSTGLSPLTRPVRRGSYYVLVAVDRVGQQMRVVIDAQRGDIVNLRPVLAGEPFATEAPRAVTAAPVSGGAAPASGARAGLENPPTPPQPGPATHAATNAPAAPPVAAENAVPPPSTRRATAEPALPPPPPLPRPRPKIVLNEAPVAAPAENDLSPPPLKPFTPNPTSATSAAEIE